MSAAPKRMVDFEAAPNIGHVLMHGGQRYEVISLIPHVRRDGAQTVLIVWRTHCAACGRPTEITSARRTNALNRRCDRCKRPGSRVRRIADQLDPAA